MKKPYSILGINLLVMFCYQVLLFSISVINDTGTGDEAITIIALLLIQSVYNLIRGVACFVNKKQPNKVGWEYIGAMFAVLLIGFPMCFVGGLTVNPWN